MLYQCKEASHSCVPLSFNEHNACLGSTKRGDATRLVGSNVPGSSGLLLGYVQPLFKPIATVSLGRNSRAEIFLCLVVSSSPVGPSSPINHQTRTGHCTRSNCESEAAPLSIIHFSHPPQIVISSSRVYTCLGSPLTLSPATLLFICSQTGRATESPQRPPRPLSSAASLTWSLLHQPPSLSLPDGTNPRASG